MSFVDSFLAERVAAREDRLMTLRVAEARDLAERAEYVRPSLLKRVGVRLYVLPPSERSYGQVHLAQPTDTEGLFGAEYRLVCWTVRPVRKGEVVLRRDESGTPLTCRKCQAWLRR